MSFQFATPLTQKRTFSKKCCSRRYKTLTFAKATAVNVTMSGAMPTAAALAVSLVAVPVARGCDCGRHTHFQAKVVSRARETLNSSKNDRKPQEN